MPLPVHNTFFLLPFILFWFFCFIFYVFIFSLSALSYSFSICLFYVLLLFFFCYGSFSLYLNVGGDMYKSSKNDKTDINKSILQTWTWPEQLVCFESSALILLFDTNMVWWLLWVKSKFTSNVHVTWFTTSTL